MDTYHTISEPSEGKYTEKMSKFYSHAFPVTTVDEARERIADMTRKYRDSRHVCWAFMLGSDRATFMSNDNGEPSGTAGKPILGQINSFGLTDIVVIVARYFGGIKLGTSGLIAAYREAARLALEAADIVEMHDMTKLTVTFPYQSIGEVMKVIKADTDVNVLGQTFDNTCVIDMSIRADKASVLSGRLSCIAGTTVLP